MVQNLSDFLGTTNTGFTGSQGIQGPIGFTGSRGFTGSSGSLDGSNQITGNLIPDTNDTYDIGSSSNALSNIYATDFIGTASSARYADLAEMFLADQNYPIGTVMMIGGDAEVTIASLNSSSLAGVISENPAYRMNSNLTGKNAVPIAYIGRVWCRVIGVIQRGNCLVTSSIPGVACSKPSHEIVPGTMIGKALQSYNSSKEGIIEIMVGRL